MSDPAPSPSGVDRAGAEHHAAVRRLFEAAIAVSGAARRRLLDEARAERPDVCAEVEGVLAQHERADAILDRVPVELVGLGSSIAEAANRSGSRGPASDGAPGSTTADAGSEGADGTLAPGARVGRYTIVRVLGVGGMGVVYEAQQDSPRRAVALKLIRSELVTRSMARRFRREAAALALLQHPAIAQIYDAGAIGAGGSDAAESGAGPVGRPFIAMEMVRGVTLAEFARAGTLSARGKLALAARICDAVQHAHQRGVIHRDLKPGNVIVESPDAAGAEASPHHGPGALGDERALSIKVLDFGVARLTEQERAPGGDGDGGSGGAAGASVAASLATRVGQIVGTLGYMSPEQASGDPARVDARTDIYAIGAILYELLVGRRPVAVESSTVAQALRAVEESSVVPPSRFDRSLRGDIDTIVMRALAREPERRYASASELGADIRRHLADQPISARPYTMGETLARAWRRRRPWFVGGMAVAATLAGGLVSTVWQAGRAVEERDRAQHQAMIAEQTNRFLSRMLGAATPGEARGRDVTVREMVDATARELGDGSNVPPEVAAGVFGALGSTYRALGEPARSEVCWRRAQDLRTAVEGPDARSTLDAATGVATALSDLGRTDEAVAMARDALSRARRLYGSNDPSLVGLLATLNYTLGRPSDAPEKERVMRECVDLSTRAFGADDRRTVRARADLALALIDVEKYDEAAGILDGVILATRRTLGPDHPETIAYMENRVALLQRLGRNAEAETIVREALSLSQRVSGPTHPSTLLARRNLAIVVAMQGRFADAEPIARELADATAARYGDRHPDAISARGLYASMLIMQRKVAEAAPVVEEVNRLAGEAFGANDDRVIQAISLRYDLAEAADDKAGMARWGERLKGTRLDPATAKQTEIPR